MTTIEVIALIFFRNYVADKFFGKGVFSKKINLKIDLNKESEIYLSVGTENTRTIFGQGPQEFLFRVEDVALRKGRPIVLLEGIQFPSSFKEIFEKSWRKRSYQLV